MSCNIMSYVTSYRMSLSIILPSYANSSQTTPSATPATPASPPPSPHAWLTFSHNEVDNLPWHTKRLYFHTLLIACFLHFLNIFPISLNATRQSLLETSHFSLLTLCSHLLLFLCRAISDSHVTHVPSSSKRFRISNNE